MIATPPHRPRIAVRRAVRAVVVDGEGNVLLIRARDTTMPELGEWWELPGGGLEAGESVAQAVIRELWEEVGLRTTDSQIEYPTWQRATGYPFHGGWRLQVESVLTVRVSEVRPACAAGQPDDYERLDHSMLAWVSLDWIQSTAARFYPGRLPHYLPRHLRREPIIEPFEWWPPAPQGLDVATLDEGTAGQ